MRLKINRKIRARRPPALPNAEPSSRDCIPVEGSAARLQGPRPQQGTPLRFTGGTGNGRPRSVRLTQAAATEEVRGTERARSAISGAAAAEVGQRCHSRAPQPPQPRPPPRLTCACGRKRGRPAAPQKQRQQDGEPGWAAPPPPGRRAEPLAPPHVLRRRPAARRRTRGSRLSASPGSSCGSRCPPPPRRGPPRHRRPRSAHTAPPAAAAAAIFRAT